MFKNENAWQIGTVTLQDTGGHIFDMCEIKHSVAQPLTLLLFRAKLSCLVLHNDMWKNKIIFILSSLEQ